MSREGVRILLALESRRRPPPSESEAERLVEFFRKKEGEDPQDKGLDSQLETEPDVEIQTP